jgi:purine-binding chemotaxis protein CheW
MTTATLDAVRETSRTENTGTMQLVSFNLANEVFGIEITKVREIILIGDITRVPQTPDYVKGLINLRNTVIPVIDLRVRFGLPAGELTEESRIMVVNLGAKTVGFVVDAVSEVLRVSKSQIAPAPTMVTGRGRDYLTGVVRLEHELLMLLDLEKILGEEEIRDLAKATA